MNFLLTTFFQELSEPVMLVASRGLVLDNVRTDKEEADAASAKVVLVGDPKQLPEIDAGGLFASLAARLGHAELSENRRQRDAQDRAVAQELRAGQVERVARLDRNRLSLLIEN